MDRDELERRIREYNPDEDIENSGGGYGIFLADLMYLYGFSNKKDISQKEFRELADEMGILNASRIGAIDSKRTILEEYAGISYIRSFNDEIIEISNGTPLEIDRAFREHYNKG